MTFLLLYLRVSIFVDDVTSQGFMSRTSISRKFAHPSRNYHIENSCKVEIVKFCWVGGDGATLRWGDGAGGRCRGWRAAPRGLAAGMRRPASFYLSTSTVCRVYDRLTCYNLHFYIWKPRITCIKTYMHANLHTSCPYLLLPVFPSGKPRKKQPPNTANTIIFTIIIIGKKFQWENVIVSRWQDDGGWLGVQDKMKDGRSYVTNSSQSHKELKHVFNNTDITVTFIIHQFKREHILTRINLFY